MPFDPLGVHPKMIAKIRGREEDVLQRDRTDTEKRNRHQDANSTEQNLMPSSALTPLVSCCAVHHIDVSMYVCTYVHTYVCMDGCMYVCTCVMHVCMYVCMYVCMHIPFYSNTIVLK